MPFYLAFHLESCLAVYLTYILSFFLALFLACILTFHLAFFLTHFSDILSGILPDFSSAVLPDIAH